MRRSVPRWYFRMSIRAREPGRQRRGFFGPPVGGFACFRATFVAKCFLGALPPVDFLAVCFVLAMVCSVGSYKLSSVAQCSVVLLQLYSLIDLFYVSSFLFRQQLCSSFSYGSPFPQTSTRKPFFVYFFYPAAVSLKYFCIQMPVSVSSFFIRMLCSWTLLGVHFFVTLSTVPILCRCLKFFLSACFVAGPFFLFFHRYKTTIWSWNTFVTFQ